jgi:hypothetical protein
MTHCGELLVLTNLLCSDLGLGAWAGERDVEAGQSQPQFRYAGRINLVHLNLKQQLQLASLDGAIKSCCADKTAIRILVNDLPGRHCVR